MSATADARATGIAAEAAIEALAREGVDHVFGLPGTTTMHLLDALSQRDDVRFVSTRHEQVAGFMADGFARASGRVGVCMASRGPGAANLTIALHNACGESVPVLALIGQVDDEIVHREAFEEVDLVALFEPLTKWALEVHDAARVPELLQRAIQTARAGRPRPVMASLPLDVQTRPVPEPDFRPPLHVAAPVPAEAELGRAAELLAGAKRPVILVGGGAERAAVGGGAERAAVGGGAERAAVGGGAERAGARDAVAALAERLAAPVAASWQRKSAFGDGHPAFVGVLGFGALEVTERALGEADVVLALGCRLSQFTSRRWTLPAAGAELIQVDVDADELGRAHPVAIGLQGDARATAQALAGHEPGDVRERSARLAELRRDYEEQSRPPDAASASSAALVRALDAARKRHDPVFVQDAPTFGVWMQRYLPVERAASYYGNAGGAMGWGLPAALGVQLARPEERVIAVVGDGSFWMVAQDLETAVRESIPVVTVVANNFAYGNTRDRQRADHGGRLFGVFYDNPDFAAFARLLGAHGERVERAEELLPALDRALASGLPAVVDVIQDQDEGLPPDVRPPGAGQGGQR